MTGGILFALLLAFLLSAAIYQRFNSVTTLYYEIDALRTAQTALTFLAVENFSDYNENPSKRHTVELAWQRIVNTQGAMFIYAIEPKSDYNSIRFIIDVANETAGYKQISSGYVMPTNSEEYKVAYRELYERGKDYSVVRDNGISLTGDHITVMITIKNSNDYVEGILCVQKQMAELDAEKNFFLKRTIVITSIVLLIMLSIGRHYLKAHLLNPLSSLTQGMREISSGNLEKKLNIKTGDELQMLAENFNTMTDELKRQMANLTKVTAEKERISTELGVAKRIQINMLPKNFSLDKKNRPLCDDDASKRSRRRFLRLLQAR